MAVSELVLVRHGESMGNAAAAAAHAASADVIEVEHRDADVPLSGVGVEQAKALGLGFRNLLADQRPTVVWSSPYVRAQQTARIALDAAGSSLPIAIDERLRDRELGILDLLTSGGDGSASSITDRPAVNPGPMWRCGSAPSSTSWRVCPIRAVRCWSVTTRWCWSSATSAST